MPDIPRLPDLLALILPLVGLASVLWALAITKQGRDREREVIRLSEEAHSLKNDFVATVSNELRTPLTSIAGFADTLVDSWQDLPEDEVDEFLAIINRQSIYLGDLVEEVPASLTPKLRRCLRSSSRYQRAMRARRRVLDLDFRLRDVWPGPWVGRSGTRGGSRPVPGSVTHCHCSDAPWWPMRNTRWISPMKKKPMQSPSWNWLTPPILPAD